VVAGMRSYYVQLHTIGNHYYLSVLSKLLACHKLHVHKQLASHLVYNAFANCHANALLWHHCTVER
jgi:hypothetical protein